MVRPPESARTTMTVGDLTSWMSSYETSWETQDADLFVTLFTDDARYLDKPFTPPVDGPDFHRMWSDLATRQSDNRFEWDILGMDGDLGFVHWHATSTRTATGEQRVGDGIFMLTFAPDGRCKELREWQHWRVIEG